MRVYYGDIAYSKNREEITVCENSYIVINDDNTVEDIYPVLPEQYMGIEVEKLTQGSVLIPAFSDMHVHAPQYMQRGLGMDALLSDWLNTYTFPEESKFKDIEYAEKIYSAFAEDMYKNGTLHASIYATLHTDASVKLCEILENKGITAYVGKVNMDMNSPDYLCETTKESLKETERYIESVTTKNVKPIITPRFAPTCSKELLYGLGKIVKKYDCLMQTHLVESIWEAAESVRLYPECSCDSEIYERSGLLDGKTAIMGHVIFPDENDIRILKKYNSLCVHCPDATTNVIAGIAPVGKLLDMGIRFAIGTDVGAGQSLALYRQISRTVQLSKLKAFYEDGNRAVTFAEAFYMATKEAGSIFGKVGSFEKGYKFEALLLSDNGTEWEQLKPQERIERFCYTGDDRNIIRIIK